MPSGDDNKNMFGDLFKNLGEAAAQDFKTAFEPNLNFDKITSLMETIEEGAVTIAKQFGQGRENIVALQASMGDALANVKAMGGEFQDIVDIQSSITGVLDRNLIVQSKTLEQIYATTKVTGVDTTTLVKGFKDAGFSLSHIRDEMQSVVEIAKKQGVSAQAVSDQVVKNMSELNRFNFEGGVAGMAKMAAQATSLRIDMKSTLDFADKMFDPEKAIEMSAALQRLGVTQSQLLDPLRMMDLAQNDPAELQNQIVEMTKGFVQMNKAGQFEILPDAKRQMRELENAMGYPAGSLAKMALGAKELEEKMSKIRFPDAFQDEESQKMIANMAEFNKGTGKYEITYTDEKTGQAVTKAVEEVTKEDIEAAQKEANKSMEDITKEQLTTTKRIQSILEAIATKSGVALAGSGFIEKGREATVLAYEAMGKPFYEGKTTGYEGKLGAKELRTEVEDKGGKAIESLMKGDFVGTLESIGSLETYFKEGWEDAMKKIGENFVSLADSSNTVLKGMVKLGGFLKENFEKAEKIDKKSGGETNQKLKVDDFLKRTYEGSDLNAGETKTSSETKESKTKVDVGGVIKLEITANGDTDMLRRELETNQTLAQTITMKVIQSVNPNINPNEMNQKLSDMSFDNIG